MRALHSILSPSSELSTPAPTFIELPKLQPGSRVSIISPSSGVAGLFPKVFELGLSRLQELYSLNVKEYPTTRKFGSSLQERAQDIMSAFQDPETEAVMASIGGSDQIRLLRFLELETIRANPKPFFGYSDNTHLCNYLWRLGIPSYYGGAVMTQLAMCGEIPDYTQRYLRAALFERGPITVRPCDSFTEEEVRWDDPDFARQQRKFYPNEGWIIDGTESVRGRLWGGCLESLNYELGVNRWLPRPSELSGAVLCLETSEEVPSEYLVESFMVSMGERGYLSAISGMIVGRPKAFFCSGRRLPLEDRPSYRVRQREVMLKILREYNSNAPVVFNFDFGHTDPQIPMPLGNYAAIDPVSRSVEICF